MILEQLCAYYERRSRDEDSGLSAYGLQRKRLGLLILIDAEGQYLGLTPTKNLAARQHQSFLVPAEIKRARQIAANFLWDNPSYVLGIEEEDLRYYDGERAFLCEEAPIRSLWESLHREQWSLDRWPRKVASFYERIRRAAEDLPEVKGLRAVLAFYERGGILSLLSSSISQNLLQHSTLISFQLAGEPQALVEDPRLHHYVQSGLDDGQYAQGRCLVSGQVDVLALIHPAIKGLKGALNTGATLVSFNQDSARFFGKKQGHNAPVGRKSAFAYTTALNHLLSPEANQAIHFNDLSLVFWSEGDEDWEQGLGQFMALTQGQSRYETFARAIEEGAWGMSQMRFFMLGLSAQKSRITVRYWHQASLAEGQAALQSLFADLEIVHAPYEARPLSLYALAAAMAESNAIEHLESRWLIELLQAIFEGKPYPQSLFYITMSLIRKEKQIGYHRAAIIKAFLVRLARFDQVQEEVGVALDRAYANVGYCLGRLFAVLEKLQEEAQQGQFSSLRDRYYVSASTTPAAIFPFLLRHKNASMARISSKTLRDRFEQEITSIFANITDIPKNLVLTDQGRFVVGYYHQRQNYFTPRPGEE